MNRSRIASRVRFAHHTFRSARLSWPLSRLELTLSFTITRMLLAVAVVAVTVQALLPYGTEGTLAMSLVSVGVGGLSLYAKRSDVLAIMRTVLFAAIGWVTCEALYPRTTGVSQSVTDAMLPNSFAMILFALFASLAYREEGDSTSTPPET